MCVYVCVFLTYVQWPAAEQQDWCQIRFLQGWNFMRKEMGGGAKGAEDVCVGTVTVFSCRIGSGKFGRSEQEVKRQDYCKSWWGKRNVGVRVERVNWKK